jgi:SAM-dependent methyltransferase
MTDRFERWLAELETRQFADLTFPEVSRALRALSATYVERRARLAHGAALSGAGKRAAFALYYGPLHWLLVHHVVSSIGMPFATVDRVVDLGCGTGAAGAGWAAACVASGAHAPAISAVDRNAWAADEARRTYQAFGLRADVRMADLAQALSVHGGARPRRGGSARGTGLLLAFTVNELSSPEDRDRLLRSLFGEIDAGAHVLVVEPLAGFVAPWWDEWERAVRERGGRADQWRVRPRVPPIVEKLGRAAGLDYREIKGRSLAV